MALFEPRPKQQAVIDYRGGRMGVSAVPGSGKTRTLSYLAAKLVAEGGLKDDQEVLIVTLTNTAVDNFSRQVGEFVRERGLLSGVGYRVRTLHGLANDILRDRAELVGLSTPFPIIDQAEADRMLEESVEAWVKQNPRWYEPYLPDGTEDVNSRQAASWRYHLSTVCSAFVRQAKDLRISPDELAERHGTLKLSLPLAEAATAVFGIYQSALVYRGAVDFGDLIRFAMDVLTIDSAYLKQIQYRWPFVLEDEAQDSSLLQEQLLRLITKKHKNWVRVGDPNQAIYETFTTASPEHLRRFMRERGVKVRELPNSGRSTTSIMALANQLSEWSRESHPSADVRALTPLAPPAITPTPSGDPQPNPPDDPTRVYIDPTPRAPDEEKTRIIDSILNALRQERPPTIAVLVPRNDAGAKFVQRLQAAKIDYFELLRTPSSARETVEHLGAMLAVLARPHESKWLELAVVAWFDVHFGSEYEHMPLVRRAAHGMIRGNPEDFLFPGDDELWDDAFPGVADLVRGEPEVAEGLKRFRSAAARWIEATMLPVDQLILTVGQELFHNPYDLAVTYALAAAMRRETELDPSVRLADVIGRVEEITQNRRPIYGVGGEDAEFDPDKHPGMVTVSTMHRAKGLEWDRVYLTSINNYDFPSDEAQDQFIGEPIFVRDRLNLEAEALAQLAVLADPSIDYVEGAASRRARLDFVAERLRLLYVGITRARKELIVMTNTGKGQATPAAPMVGLDAWWSSRDAH